MSFRSLLAAAAAGVAIALPVTAEAAPKKLIATVGPGETIVLKTASGARVRTLTAGAYVITVRDLSAEHNFHLRGRGVNKTSAVGFVGTQTWRVTLRRGAYAYVCDPHADSMRGSFRVR